MALTKEDLGQIKEVVLEAIEPMKMEIKKEIEELAIMTKHGFDSVDEQFKKMNGRIDRLEKDHEDMALRLDNVAYRFELVELKQRVEVLEKKAAVRV